MRHGASINDRRNVKWRSTVAPLWSIHSWSRIGATTPRRRLTEEVLMTKLVAACTAAALLAGCTLTHPARVGEQITPAVIRNVDGRLEAFRVNGSGRLSHRYQMVGAAGGTWSGWEDLPGADLAGPVSVVRRQDNELELFARGTNNHLMRQARGAFGIWSAWTDLGGPASGEMVQDPSAVVGSDGRIQVFVLGSGRAAPAGNDNRIWSRTAVGPNQEQYGDWVMLPEGRFTGAPTAFVQGATTHVFARGLNSRVWHGSTTTPGRWTLVGGDGPGQGPEGNSRIVVVANTSGLPDVVVNSVDTHYAHAEAPNGQLSWRWSRFRLPGQSQGDPAAISSNGAVRVFARFTNHAAGSASHIGMIEAAEGDAASDAWLNLGGTPRSSPAGGDGMVAIVNQEGKVTFPVRLNGRMQWQETPE
jgi:hypothetical protein